MITRRTLIQFVAKANCTTMTDLPKVKITHDTLEQLLSKFEMYVAIHARDFSDQTDEEVRGAHRFAMLMAIDETFSGAIKFELNTDD